MKLFSAELLTAGDQKTTKAVILEKKRSSYTLLQHYITEPENLKSLSGELNYYFCIDYYDTIIETVEIPPVKDSKTFRLLAKNKLKEHLEEDVSYLIAYKKDEDVKPDKAGSALHNVYMVPESLFEKDAGLVDHQKLNMDMFTLSDFALCGISDYFFPDEVVFHSFADETKVIVTVSKGKKIIYTREMEYNTSEVSSIESIFYESINLTYMFVTKNQHISIDRMILSGQLADKSELSQMLFDFNKKTQSVVIPGSLFKDCSNQQFRDFMIPLSLCLLEDTYDFTPEKYKVARGFNILKTAVNSIAIVATLILLLLNMSAFEELSFAKEKARGQNNVIKMKLDRNVHNFKDSGERRYNFYYIKQVQKYGDDAFDLYKETAGLINTADYKSVKFEKDKDKVSLKVFGDVKFTSFKGIDDHRQMIEREVSQIENNGKYKVKNTSRYNSDTLVASINLSIESGKK
ncbi:MAG: hypothetical protein C0603_13005 [Denitrovibrio sp.]|nr:MAG: hypothetical protein C0603_13005 [Denitrovibrio sp.]